MENDIIAQQLKSLIATMVNLTTKQKKQLMTMLKEMSVSDKKKEDDIELILSNMRICVQYLLFDLEATRRERDLFKTMLDDERPPNTTEGSM